LLSKRVTATAVLALLLLASSAAVSAAKPKPKLKVTELSSPPATGTAGTAFEVTGTVTNKGKRKSKPRVKVFLRTEPKGANAARLANSKIGKVRPKRKRAFGLALTIPGVQGQYSEGSLAPGSYLIVACVKRRGNTGALKCRASQSRIEVTAPDGPEPPPPPPPPPDFQPGARSADDSLFPQIGNGGYDAEQYDIELFYDPDTNEFIGDTKTTMTAVATQDLSEFSLDFQQLAVSGVTVNGAAAEFTQEEAEPPLESSIGVTDATQPSKLTVTPAEGIVEGTEFEVEISYTGEPEVWTDVDGALEGWIPACFTVAAVETCDGNYVVGEPLGAQAWFPSNNVPDDKAAFNTSITLPVDQQAVGIGELVGSAPVSNGDGTHTWNWSEDDEVSTYLATASNGTAAFTQDSVNLATGPLAIYNFVDSTNPVTVPTTEANLRRGRGQLQFLEDAYGPYPWDSSGAWADRTTGIGYALEVATKSHYPGNNTGASVNTNTQLHELAHQWFGNSATNEDWADLWFNEGWAEWSTWYWQFEDGGVAISPAQRLDEEYATAAPEDWETPPATLLGDPALMFFPDFPTYVRGAMTLQGYREIIGEASFLAFAKGLQQDFAHDNITTEEFVDYALDFSGLGGAQLDLLAEYFDQWLYGDVQPTILPEDFAPAP
jgi:aminopeptidase N